MENWEFVRLSDLLKQKSKDDRAKILELSNYWLMQHNLKWAIAMKYYGKCKFNKGVLSGRSYDFVLHIDPSIKDSLLRFTKRLDYIQEIVKCESREVAERIKVWYETMLDKDPYSTVIV